MTFAEFLLFAFGTIGISHLVVDSVILEPVRNFIKKYLPEKITYLTSCYSCSAFYLGVFIGFLLFGLNIPLLIVCSFAGSFLSNLAAVVLNWIETATVIHLDSTENERK
jgi:hypothetical protein